MEHIVHPDNNNDISMPSENNTILSINTSSKNILLKNTSTDTENLPSLIPTHDNNHTVVDHTSGHSISNNIPSSPSSSQTNDPQHLSHNMKEEDNHQSNCTESTVPIVVDRSSSSSSSSSNNHSTSISSSDNNFNPSLFMPPFNFPFPYSSFMNNFHNSMMMGNDPSLFFSKASMMFPPSSSFMNSFFPFHLNQSSLPIPSSCTSAPVTATTSENTNNSTTTAIPSVNSSNNDTGNTTTDQTTTNNSSTALSSSSSQPSTTAASTNMNTNTALNTANDDLVPFTVWLPKQSHPGYPNMLMNSAGNPTSSHPFHFPSMFSNNYMNPHNMMLNYPGPTKDMLNPANISMLSGNPIPTLYIHHPDQTRITASTMQSDNPKENNNTNLTRSGRSSTSLLSSTNTTSNNNQTSNTSTNNTQTSNSSQSTITNPASSSSIPHNPIPEMYDNSQRLYSTVQSLPPFMGYPPPGYMLDNNASRSFNPSQLPMMQPFGSQIPLYSNYPPNYPSSNFSYPGNGPTNYPPMNDPQGYFSRLPNTMPQLYHDSSTSSAISTMSNYSGASMGNNHHSNTMMNNIPFGFTQNNDILSNQFHQHTSTHTTKRSRKGSSSDKDGNEEVEERRHHRNHNHTGNNTSTTSISGNGTSTSERKGLFIPKEFTKGASKYSCIYLNEGRWAVCLHGKKRRFRTRLEADAYYEYLCNHKQKTPMLRQGYHLSLDKVYYDEILDEARQVYFNPPQYILQLCDGRLIQLREPYGSETSTTAASTNLSSNTMNNLSYTAVNESDPTTNGSSGTDSTVPTATLPPNNQKRKRETLSDTTSNGSSTSLTSEKFRNVSSTESPLLVQPVPYFPALPLVDNCKIRKKRSLTNKRLLTDNENDNSTIPSSIPSTIANTDHEEDDSMNTTASVIRTTNTKIINPLVDTNYTSIPISTTTVIFNNQKETIVMMEDKPINHHDSDDESNIDDDDDDDDDEHTQELLDELLNSSTDDTDSNNNNHNKLFLSKRKVTNELSTVFPPLSV